MVEQVVAAAQGGTTRASRTSAGPTRGTSAPLPPGREQPRRLPTPAAPDVRTPISAATSPMRRPPPERDGASGSLTGQRLQRLTRGPQRDPLLVQGGVRGVHEGECAGDVSSCTASHDLRRGHRPVPLPQTSVRQQREPVRLAEDPVTGLGPPRPGGARRRPRSCGSAGSRGRRGGRGRRCADGGRSSSRRGYGAVGVTGDSRDAEKAPGRRHCGDRATRPVPGGADVRSAHETQGRKDDARTVVVEAPPARALTGAPCCRRPVWSPHPPPRRRTVRPSPPRYGQVRGATGESANAYLGIPYAAPPVGDRRAGSRPPRLARWAGVRDATAPRRSLHAGEPVHPLGRSGRTRHPQ